MLIPDDPLHAFVDVPDVPVSNAAHGPLAGLTLAVKDIFDVAGYVTGCGSPEKTAEGAPAVTHAAAVAKLLAAGARFVGKTHTAELAFSLDGRNEHYGTPVNPAATDRVPGGSSSGSAAAVAGGLVDIALGSDTGGSVRGPASFCGIIGLRPSHGRVDITGVMPLAPSLDTVGWFAREIDVFAEVGGVLLGDDDSGPALTQAVIAEDAFPFLDDDAREVLDPLIRRVARTLSSPRSVEMAPEGLEAWRDVFRTLQGYEAWQAHGAWVEAHKPDLNRGVAERLQAAKLVTLAEQRAADVRRQEIARRMAGIVRDDTVIVLPTMPGAAPPLHSSEETFESFRRRALPLLCAAGLAGLPQISLPLITVNSLPVGLSLIGPARRDRALISLAARVLML
jgi:amidase